MYAIFETGGKQYTAKVGDVLYIEKLNAEVDQTVTFEKVLAVGDDTMTFGTPYVEGMTVSGKVLKNGKAKKIVVMTYRPKKDSKRCRRLRSEAYADATNEATIKKMIPYK